MYFEFEYICWKFAGRLLDRVNTPSVLAAPLRKNELRADFSNNETPLPTSHYPPVRLLGVKMSSSTFHVRLLRPRRRFDHVRTCPANRKRVFIRTGNESTYRATSGCEQTGSKRSSAVVWRKFLVVVFSERKRVARIILERSSLSAYTKMQYSAKKMKTTND